MKRPLLQVALDATDLPSALRPLALAADHVDVVEVGTVLCLSEGMHAVRAVRAVYPDKEILADVRIVEAGSIIAELAFSAGASLVTVVAGAETETFKAVVARAKQANGQVQVELNTSWSDDDARRWWDLGVTHAIVHRSRDAEVLGEFGWSKRDLASLSFLDDIGYKVTVTGGMNLEDVEALAGEPISIIIVGRGIVQADDPERAAREFKTAIARAWP